MEIRYRLKGMHVGVEKKDSLLKAPLFSVKQKKDEEEREGEREGERE